MSRDSRVVPWVVGVAVAVAAAQAQAQSNLDAGKSPAQIFSDTCNACHRSPRELKQTSPGFLREHYTTGGREAAAMAAYLSSVGSDARAVQQRVMPPGRRTPAEQAKPPQGPATAAAIKPRRPSESIEAGKLPEAGATEAAPSQAAVAPRQHPAHEFEE